MFISKEEEDWEMVSVVCWGKGFMYIWIFWLGGTDYFFYNHYHQKIEHWNQSSLESYISKYKTIIYHGQVDDDINKRIGNKSADLMWYKEEVV